MEIYGFMLSPRVNKVLANCVNKALFTQLNKTFLNTKWTAGYFKGRLDLQFHKHFLEAEIILFF